MADNPSKGEKNENPGVTSSRACWRPIEENRDSKSERNQRRDEDIIDPPRRCVLRVLQVTREDSNLYTHSGLNNDVDDVLSDTIITTTYRGGRLPKLFRRSIISVIIIIIIITIVH